MSEKNNESKKVLKEEDLKKAAGGGWIEKTPFKCNKCGHEWESISFRNCPECGSDDISII